MVSLLLVSAHYQNTDTLMAHDGSTSAVLSLAVLFLCCGLHMLHKSGQRQNIASGPLSTCDPHLVTLPEMLFWAHAPWPVLTLFNNVQWVINMTARGNLLIFTQEC